MILTAWQRGSETHSSGFNIHWERPQTRSHEFGAKLTCHHTQHVTAILSFLKLFFFTHLIIHPSFSITLAGLLRLLESYFLISQSYYSFLYFHISLLKSPRFPILETFSSQSSKHFFIIYVLLSTPSMHQNIFQLLCFHFLQLYFIYHQRQVSLTIIASIHLQGSFFYFWFQPLRFVHSPRQSFTPHQ